jgi:hypothetical protein
MTRFFASVFVVMLSVTPVLAQKRVNNNSWQFTDGAVTYPDAGTAAATWDETPAYHGGPKANY